VSARWVNQQGRLQLQGAHVLRRCGETEDVGIWAGAWPLGHEVDQRHALPGRADGQRSGRPGALPGPAAAGVRERAGRAGPGDPRRPCWFHGDGNIANFKRRQQTDLKHGRVSVLASIGASRRRSLGSSLATCIRPWASCSQTCRTTGRPSTSCPRQLGAGLGLRGSAGRVGTTVAVGGSAGRVGTTAAVRGSAGRTGPNPWGTAGRAGPSEAWGTAGSAGDVGS